MLPVAAYPNLCNSVGIQKTKNAIYRIMRTKKATKVRKKAHFVNR